MIRENDSALTGIFMSLMSFLIKALEMGIKLTKQAFEWLLKNY